MFLSKGQYVKSKKLIKEHITQLLDLITLFTDWNYTERNECNH